MSISNRIPLTPDQLKALREESESDRCPNCGSMIQRAESEPYPPKHNRTEGENPNVQQ